MITTWSIPDKVEDLYPQKALELEKNRRVLVDFFLKNKFELISPAMIEYADNVSFNGKSVDSDMFKLSDPSSLLKGSYGGAPPDTLKDMSAGATRRTILACEPRSVMQSFSATNGPAMARISL